MLAGSRWLRCRRELFIASLDKWGDLGMQMGSDVPKAGRLVSPLPPKRSQP